eukprot:scaffold91519_cov62-Attheya_sp.AAC.1
MEVGAAAAVAAVAAEVEAVLAASLCMPLIAGGRSSSGLVSTESGISLLFHLPLVTPLTRISIFLIVPYHFYNNGASKNIMLVLSMQAIRLCILLCLYTRTRGAPLAAIRRNQRPAVVPDTA